MSEPECCPRPGPLFPLILSVRMVFGRMSHLLVIQQLPGTGGNFFEFATVKFFCKHMIVLKKYGFLFVAIVARR